jgi:hypothetical protein
VKIFQQRELLAAYAHAAAGGQALHLMNGNFAYLQTRTPKCFHNRTVIAHLFDQNHERLIGTAKRLGVRVIKVEHAGSERQHIDLCGKPLDRAVRLADKFAQHEKEMAAADAALLAQTLLPLDLNAAVEAAR